MYTTPLSTLISSLCIHQHLYVDNTQLFFSFHPLNIDSTFLIFETLSNASLPGWLLIVLLLILLRQNSCSSDWKTNSPKYTTLYLTPPTLLETLALSLTNISERITSLSKACYYHIRQLRCMRPYLVSSTAYTIATCIVHYKLDYCNSHYKKFPKSQLSSLQQIQNSLACTIVKAPMSSHITPILRSLYWLRITEYKLLLLTYKVLTTTQPPYLHNLISIQRPRSIRSSSVVTVAQPPSSSSLKITDRSFCYASPCL